MRADVLFSWMASATVRSILELEVGTGTVPGGRRQQGRKAAKLKKRKMKGTQAWCRAADE